MSRLVVTVPWWLVLIGGVLLAPVALALVLAAVVSLLALAVVTLLIAGVDALLARARGDRENTDHLTRHGVRKEWSDV